MNPSIDHPKSFSSSNDQHFSFHATVELDSLDCTANHEPKKLMGLDERRRQALSEIDNAQFDLLSILLV